jgi:hypothetical protein
MAVAPKSLLVGLLVGVFLALLAPQLVSHSQLPIQEEAGELGSSSPLSIQAMAQVLKNIAKRGVAGGYKSLWVPPSTSTSSLLRSSSTPTASSISKQSSFSTTTSTMSAQKSFLDAVKERRTYYALNKEAPISDKRITEIAEQAVLHVPSSFNSQSTRLVVLLNKDHDTFWGHVLDVLKPLVPEDQFPSTAERINGFKGAYGTVSTSIRFSMWPSCQRGQFFWWCRGARSFELDAAPPGGTRAPPSTRLLPLHRPQKSHALTQSG